MKTTVIRESDTPASLSARLGVPYCRLLRANGLFSGAWLLPGREIAVPEETFCQTAAFPCPVLSLRAPARALRPVTARWGDTPETLAKQYDMEADWLMRVNGLAFLLPGMRLLVPR